MPTTPCITTNNLNTNIALAYAEQNKINDVICNLIGKIYRFDHEKEGRSESGSRLDPFNYISGKNDVFGSKEGTLNCIFNLKKDVEHESIPQRNWRALVKNKVGEWIPDEAMYTIKQLSDTGIYTFNCPDEMNVKVSLFCNGSKSCNKNMRMIQECKETGKSLAECQNWTLQETLDWAAEQASMNDPDQYSYSIATSGGELKVDNPETPIDADAVLAHAMNATQMLSPSPLLARAVMN